MTAEPKILKHVQAKRMRASGMSFQQIADTLGVTKGTAQVHCFYNTDLNRARRRLDGKVMTLHIPAELMALAYTNVGGQKPYIQRLINILATETTLVRNLCEESDDADDAV